MNPRRFLYRPGRRFPWQRESPRPPTEPPLDTEAVALVEAHARLLLGQLSAQDERLLRARLEARPDLKELTRLAEALAAAIQPVSPEKAFRDDLARRLAEHHPASSQEETLRAWLSQAPLWTWPVAAGVPVMLGLLAFVWLRRQQVTTGL